MNRQPGFYKDGRNYYTCEEVFDDCEKKCNEYLRNKTRYRHLAKPAFSKVERAIAKGIDKVEKHHFPYKEDSDKLTRAQQMAQIEWIKGPRPSDRVFDRLFDVQKTIDQQQNSNRLTNTP